MCFGIQSHYSSSPYIFLIERKRTAAPYYVGAGQLVWVRPYCPVKQKQFHRISTSNKVTLGTRMGQDKNKNTPQS